VFRDHLKRASSNDGIERRGGGSNGHGGILNGRSAQQQQQQNQSAEQASGIVQKAVSDGDIHIHDHERALSQELTDLATVFLPNAGADLPFLEKNKVQIKGFQPHIVPLDKLELGQNDVYQPLLDQNQQDETASESWTEAEKEAVHLLRTQRAAVKTIKDSDWTDFLMRFRSTRKAKSSKYPNAHDDIAPHENFPFNSFVTSTTLLPPDGRKMRCYGSLLHYCTGVLFALPDFDAATNEETEDEAVKRTETWSWPSGYSAKTEFNIDGRGQLINGRKEALVSLEKLREYNNDYIHKQDYVVAGRIIKGGLTTVPYNEVYLRVGGLGRIVNGRDVATGRECSRSFDYGVGLPAALFVRSASYGHLISLFRTRARLLHLLGEKHIKNIPLLLITSEHGVRVITEPMQREIFKKSAQSLNPFQNPVIAHNTTMDNSSGSGLKTKLEELIELDETIRTTLTPEECARLAGGFGATDDSVAHVLKDALLFDKASKDKDVTSDSHRLQDVVNEGLSAAVRAGDYHTSRQLLILYTLVASEGEKMDERTPHALQDEAHSKNKSKKADKQSALGSEAVMLQKQSSSLSSFSDTSSDMPATAPPPPPLDTDRLRSATNSDGLLAVLGAAQVLKAMKDGSAQKRAAESIFAIEEWIEHGEQSMAFRLASWRDQRAAQGDLRIATQNDSNFLAFVSNKAISNRKTFARQMKDAVANTDFKDVRFLHAILEILSRMHSPCLRLELLQYVLGLDNRYSVGHVERSVELAVTCLSIATASI